ncbi:mannosyltransferase family protein [Oscillatoria laete-virens NRMC-F 0139]|nr:mannosyltransferase family protein [Oscillatoria laete-virens]MDL5054058.1 mannosyltransferase family protein [Oscillatoria laete-virens NRMC-F 0139]
MTLSRRDVLIILILFALTRAALTIVGAITVQTVPSTEGAEYTHLLDDVPALDMWYRWDAGFYTSIAEYGYDWFNDRQPTADLAFFPLYPTAIRAASTLIGFSETGCWLSVYRSTCTTIGGLIVSNLALLASAFLLYDLARARFDGRAAIWSVVLLLITPNLIFLSGVYTESLFLLLCLLTFWLIERGRFYPALLPAILACLTRSVGIALFPALLYAAWRAPADQRWRRVMATFVLPLTFGGWIVFAGLIAGDPLAYFSAYQTTWGRASSSPLEAFTLYFSGEDVALLGWWVSWIDLAAALGYLALGIWTLRQDRAWGLFTLSAVIIPIATGTLLSMPRFGAALFPFYILLGAWADRRWKQALLIVVCLGLGFIFVTRFVTWRWIA